MATIGNMRPLIEDADRRPVPEPRGDPLQGRLGPALHVRSREEPRTGDRAGPAAPPRRPDPRGWPSSTTDKLLVTTSDDAVKLWDGLTGEPRRRRSRASSCGPLFFGRAAARGRFATVDVAGQVVTLWDAKTLERSPRSGPRARPG